MSCDYKDLGWNWFSMLLKIVRPSKTSYTNPLGQFGNHCLENGSNKEMYFLYRHKWIRQENKSSIFEIGFWYQFPIEKSNFSLKPWYFVAAAIFDPFPINVVNNTSDHKAHLGSSLKKMIRILKSSGFIKQIIQKFAAVATKSFERQTTLRNGILK